MSTLTHSEYSEESQERGESTFTYKSIEIFIIGCVYSIKIIFLAKIRKQGRIRHEKEVSQVFRVAFHAYMDRSQLCEHEFCNTVTLGY